MAALVNYPMQVGDIPVVGPAHHQVSKIYDECTWSRFHVDPGLRGTVEDLKTTYLVLKKDGYCAKICVRANACGERLLVECNFVPLNRAYLSPDSRRQVAVVDSVAILALQLGFLYILTPNHPPHSTSCKLS